MQIDSGEGHTSTSVDVGVVYNPSVAGGFQDALQQDTPSSVYIEY